MKILHWNNDWNFIMNLFCIRTEIVFGALQTIGSFIVANTRLPVYATRRQVN